MRWFAETYPYVPERCANGHPLGEGRISVSFVQCTCAAVTDDRGHAIAQCRVNGCRAAYGPDGCLGQGAR